MIKFLLIIWGTAIAALGRSQRDIAGQNRMANNRDRHMLGRRGPSVEVPSIEHQIALVPCVRKQIAAWVINLKNNDVASIKRAQALFNVFSSAQSPEQDRGQSHRLSRFLHHGSRFN